MNTISINTGNGNNGIGNNGINNGVAIMAIVTNPNTPIPGVQGWTYGQAVRELIEGGNPVDLELFPFAASWLGITSGAPAHDQSVVDVDAFERETGWSYSDAVDEAAEARRSRRLFGRWAH
jgi:hypothetical protein